MKSKNGGSQTAKALTAFDATALLKWTGAAKTAVEYARGASVFSQGDPCDCILYIQKGGVKLSVLSKTGQEAVVAIIGPGDFFGEGCLVGQPIRLGSATAIAPSTIVFVAKDTMIRLLHEQHDMSDCFISHLLARKIRSEEDLADQLFNSSEKRLARALLLLAQYGEPDKPVRTLPEISQETLAAMIGTTRSRVNFFLNKFKKLGFIEYDGGLKIHGARLTVVLHDSWIS
jgi:CRP/FNR family cyclic AMP-dependent transcriptional regulator